MGQRLIDDNGVINFVDDLGVQCFIDDLGNFTCVQAPTGNVADGYVETEW